MRVYSNHVANQLIFILRRTIQKSLGLAGIRLSDPVSRYGVVKDLPQMMHRWAVDCLTDERRKAIDRE